MANDARLDSMLRQHALALKDVAECVDTDDLQPLQRLLRGVRVVGLGETTHGTKEFFQVRHRLSRFLIEAMGFNVLAIEGSFAATRLVNDYVLGAQGDLSAVLTAIGSVMWDVVEFGEVLDWLRRYNRSVGHEQRVRFLGIDIFHTRLSREHLLTWLQRVAPHRVTTAESLFQAIATAELSGLLLAHKILDEAIAARLRELSDGLRAEKHALIERSSDTEYDGAMRRLEVILQWVRAYGYGGATPPLLGATGLNNYARSVFMADNLVDYVIRISPDAKVAVWAHNLHISVGFLHDETRGAVPNFGQRLRETFGNGYYALGLELNRGEYLCREWAQPGRTLGDLKIGRISPASVGWLPWRLARVGRQFLLELRSLAARDDMAAWLSSPQTMFCAGWAHSDPTLTTRVILQRQYDGILFVESTSPTTPTANAITTVARRESH
jgi:erythromycin esterase